MKKMILFLALFVFAKTNAQTINSLTVFPPNPTTSDNILILAECTFGSGSCDQHTQGYSVGGNTINSWALHCLGMLTVICTDTDTFAVGMLPAGVYTINFHLDNGYGTVPCTPGIVAGPDATATFTVSIPTTISEEELNDNSFNVFPNPVINKLAISNGQSVIKTIEVFDVLGQQRIILNPSSKGKGLFASIDVSELAPGIYFLRITKEKTQRIIKITKM